MDRKLDPVQVFVDFLKSRGLNVTRSRLAVLQALADLPRHFEAADLWAVLRSRVSPATVYRTLDLLEKAGLVRKVEFGEAHAHYERAFGREDHGHLICRICGGVWEFPVGQAQHVVEQAAHEQGFFVDEVVVQGYGICPRCRARRDSRV
ncbi:transcriptional repressor [Candidatus Bipolaricaulota bacterium]|nr:transcriptional repressor [Candidatus Bipolaricaulota bacterium]